MAKKKVQLDVVYPEPSAAIAKLYADEAKQMLGWELVEEPKKGEELYKHLDGLQYRLNNNRSNRVLEDARADWIAQEILRGRYKLNGETIVVGKCGSTLSAQHRLIGLIRATYLWESSPEDYPAWKQDDSLPNGGAPHIETFVAYGIDETDETINTLDTGRPRSLTDVLYRMDLFAKLAKPDRIKAAKAADYAIRLVWHRTGVKDAYGILRTHAESVEFLLRHQRIVKMVLHVLEEDVNSGDEKSAGESPMRLSQYLPLGTLSGLAYLMAASGTEDGKKYLASKARSESRLDWSRWDEAQEFIVGLASGKYPVVGKALGDMDAEQPVNVAERTALLILAWEAYRDGNLEKAKGLTLDVTYNDEGRRYLDEYPVLGGIDLGEPDEDVTEDEVEVAKTEVQRENGTGEAEPEGIKVGASVWVEPEDGGPWRGRLISLDGDAGTARIKIAKGFAGAGKEVEAPASQLRDRQPRPVEVE